MIEMTPFYYYSYHYLDLERCYLVVKL